MTIMRTQSSGGEMQKSASKCLMGRNREIWKRYMAHSKNNFAIRRHNSMPTVFPQLRRDGLCDIYRWETSRSPAYLNNQEDIGNPINIWEIFRQSVKNNDKNRRCRTAGRNGVGIYETFKN